MQYLNLSAAALDSAQFIGAEPVDRGTWICLLRYCVGQENSGVIVACKTWSDRKWQQIARVTKNEVERITELWRFTGNDMTVFGYPLEQQECTKRLRERGKMAAHKRWKIKDLMPHGMPIGNGYGNGVAHAKDKIIEDKISQTRARRTRHHAPLKTGVLDPRPAD